MKKDYSLIGFSIFGFFLGGYKTLNQSGFHFYVGLAFIVLSLVLLTIFLLSLRKTKEK
ncbi:hypothetical protein L1N85_02150 [Paenibacillus alkaliterrae]|uniref:hypothetical protein n=1 Tax=Paenibacillus alkaliterrae TaxID=320909 RepID=UPI001F3BDA78|nr:hypothetical protein [Paenibacillus alkaliterrae]MCF2937231.1 hypothetical protein [Paenibacillus alkaliterrae]